MLRAMRIFTGADLHKPASRVMVKADLHFVTVYYLQCIRLISNLINPLLGNCRSRQFGQSVGRITSRYSGAKTEE